MALGAGCSTSSRPSATKVANDSETCSVDAKSPASGSDRPPNLPRNAFAFVFGGVGCLFLYRSSTLASSEDSCLSVDGRTGRIGGALGLAAAAISLAHIAARSGSSTSEAPSIRERAPVPLAPELAVQRRRLGARRGRAPGGLQPGAGRRLVRALQDPRDQSRDDRSAHLVGHEARRHAARAPAPGQQAVPETLRRL